MTSALISALTYNSDTEAALRGQALRVYRRVCDRTGAQREGATAASIRIKADQYTIVGGHWLSPIGLTSGLA